MTPTELRAHIYGVIDRVIATGEPCEIVRGDKRVYISTGPEKAKKPKSTTPNEGQMTRLSKLPRRKAFMGTEEELLNFSVWDEKAWDKKWKKRLGE